MSSHRVFINNGCYFCNDKSKTIEHISRDCPFVHSFLYSFSEFSLILVAAPVFALLWLVSCSKSLSKVSFAFLLFALWSVWKDRNKRVWIHKFTLMASLVALTRSQYHLSSSTRFPTTPPRQPHVRQPWKPLPLGWLKANADKAFNKALNAGGISVAIQNHCGDVVGGVCIQILHVESPEMVEALASRATCELAINFFLGPIVFEVDSLLVVQATKVIGANTYMLGRIYEDIYACLQELPDSSFFTCVS